MTFKSPHPDVHIPDISVTGLVLDRTDIPADGIAFVDGVSGRGLTFGELRDHVRRVAAGLARQIGKGDVVALWAPNVPEYAVVFHAVLRLGAVLTTLNPAYGNDEVAFQLRDARARMLVTVGSLAERAREAIAIAGLSIEIVTIDTTDGLQSLSSIALDAEPPHVTIYPATDVAVLPYSSGTTGLQKGVMLTHRNLVANLVQIDAIEERDLPAFVAVLPFFHIYGMVVIMNFGMMRGTTTVTLARYDLEAFLRVIQEWRVRLAHVAPPLVVALAKHPMVDTFDLSSLKWLFCGAAPLSAELTELVQTRMDLKIRQGYGMTEASPATHYACAGSERPGTIGPLVPNTECRLVDPVTGRDVGTGVPGEIWVRGPQVMKGYLNNPEATAATVDADGWLHTGDIGIVDDNGFLAVTDRLKELIKVKGYQVAPAELEALLLKHPKVADAAVIAVPDDETGERPKAFVVASAPVTGKEVLDFVSARVAYYKQPASIVFIDSIPKSPSGKILRRVLVEQERVARAAVAARPSF